MGMTELQQGAQDATSDHARGNDAPFRRYLDIDPAERDDYTRGYLSSFQAADASWQLRGKD